MNGTTLKGKIGHVKDYSKCPKCGSENIIANRDFNNAWIKCGNCGYLLRKGKVDNGIKRHNIINDKCRL